jgi:hypothetical protein
MAFYWPAKAVSAVTTRKGNAYVVSRFAAGGDSVDAAKHGRKTWGRSDAVEV